MPVLSCRLDDLLPHRPPMVLVDDVVAYDATRRQVTVAATIREPWSENWVAIELMAQTAAALAGLFDRQEGASGCPRPGFLLGTRKLTLRVPRFEVGRRYLISATNEFCDDETASFACQINDEAGNVVATAVLTAYRPENLSAFLSEQRGHRPSE